MYLDPGFGGMLIQIIVAVVAAGGAIAFSLRKKIRALFLKDKGEKGTVIREAKDMNNLEGEVIDMLSEEDSAEK